MTRRACFTLALLAAAARAASAQPVTCLAIAGRSVTKSPVEISMTPAGTRALQGAALAFVHVLRIVDGTTMPEYVRLIEPDASPLTFSFGHEGVYRITLWSANGYGWPTRNEVGQQPLTGCQAQDVSIAPNDEADFTGVRAQAWLAYRPLTSGEIGTSTYFGRFGVAVAAIASAAESSEPNRVIGAGEIRWRGARGYVGGGVRYFPHAEPNRNQWRPTAVAGEELPLFKGKPLWFVLDLRFDDEDFKPWGALSLSFAVRMDLTNGKHP